MGAVGWGADIFVEHDETSATVLFAGTRHSPEADMK